MTNCTYCKWAVWDRTESGRLHPSGDGRCGFQIKMPVVPVAFYHVHGKQLHDYYCGGWINRRVELKEHCPCYERNNR